MVTTFSYSFETGVAAPAYDGQFKFENPLFNLLAAIQKEGSIGRAATLVGWSYRHAWGFLKKQEAFFGQKLMASTQGEAARLSEFGERLLWAEKRTLARLQPIAEAMAAKLDNELLLAVRPDLASVSVCASHDLLFGILRDRVCRQADVLLDIDYVGSARALEQLNLENCTLAGVHIPLGDPQLCRRGSGFHYLIGRQLRLGDHKLIRLARREQGLIVAPGNPLDLHTVSDLQREGVVFVNRQAGSGTRVLFDELLDLHQIPEATIQGYGTEESTHLAVAATVAAGAAHCGFGLRAAASRFNLDFVPVLEEDYFVVCHKPTLDSPALQAVIEVLGSEEFRRQIEALPGYSAVDSGQIVSLRRTLPWYK